MTSRKSKTGAGGPQDRTPKRAAAPSRETKPLRGFARPDQVAPDPWRVPVMVEQIPATGMERNIVADAGQLAAIAAMGGLRAVASAQATFTLTPIAGGNVHVSGRVMGRIGQTCVVTLDPMETEINEPIDIVFAPASKIPPLASTIDDSIEDDSAIPDPPEPIEDGMIDIGRVATDALFLAVDPYPRKPDAVFEPPAEQADPDEHPFAALKALRPDSKKPE